MTHLSKGVLLSIFGIDAHLELPTALYKPSFSLTLIGNTAFCKKQKTTLLPPKWPNRKSLYYELLGEIPDAMQEIQRRIEKIGTLRLNPIKYTVLSIWRLYRRLFPRLNSYRS